MYTLSDIYILETSHYIQSVSDQYIIESYTCESFRDVVNNLIDKIKKMFNKVKEFFKKLFGKESNDKKIEDIEKVVNNNPKIKNEKIEVVDTSKFDKIVDNANKQGKKITAKQIIAAAGITTATVGAVLLGIKKFKKNTPNELDKQEKEAIKKAENIKKEEEKKVVNNTTNTEPKTVNKEDKKINSYKLANNKYKGNGTRQKVNTSIKTNTEPKTIGKNGKYKLSTNQKYKGIRQVKTFDERYKELLLKQSNELEKINATMNVNDSIMDKINKEDAIKKATHDGLKIFASANVYNALNNGNYDLVYKIANDTRLALRGKGLSSTDISSLMYIQSLADILRYPENVDLTRRTDYICENVEYHIDRCFTSHEGDQNLINVLKRMLNIIYSKK